MKKLPTVLPDDDGIRAAGEPDKCFYCGQKVGDEHKFDCVVLNRKIKIRYSFDVETEVPYSWNAHDIEFHRNEGSWCANNAVYQLNNLIDEKSCLCNYFEARVLEIPEAEPYRYNKNHEIVP